MEQIKVEIKSKDKEYKVLVGSSILPELLSFIQNKHPDKKTVVITEDNVKKLYGNRIMDILKPLNPHMISVREGEESKSRKVKEKIEDELLEKRYGRDTVIVAFGGGVVGDLAGYIASTYNRGIPVIQVPTTLLAMVDSSVGGKTGINTKHGKNLIGATYQPDAVFADLDFLNELPKSELSNGLSEIVKIAITSDNKLFSFIEKNHKKILAKEKDTLISIIKRSVELKRDVVEKDEKEEGLRQIVNFGHTIGHALETHHSYKVPHGYCVSIGIRVESKIAELSGNLKSDEGKRIKALLNLLGLPTKIQDIKTDSLIELMKSDKKVRKGKIRFVIIRGIGQIKKEHNDFSFEIDKKTIINSIDLCKND